MNSFQLTMPMPLLGNVKREAHILPERLEYLLDDIRDERQAIQFALARAGRTQTVVGEELGLQKSHWSGICNGTKNMSWKIKTAFMDLIGNDILLQWQARRRGFRLVRMEPTQQEKLETQLAEQRAENERLRAQIAATRRQA